MTSNIPNAEGPGSGPARELTIVPTGSAQHMGSSRANHRGDDDNDKSSGSMFDIALWGISFLRRQWLLLAGGLVLGAILFPLGFLVMPPAFKSTATIVIDTNRVQLFPQQSVIGETPIENAAALESQLELIRSAQVATKVMDRLNLREDPEFRVQEITRTERLLGPQVAEFFGRERLRTEAQRERNRLEKFAGRLTARRVPGSFVVEISFESQSSEKAAAITNAVADAYLETLIQQKQDVNRRTGNWLNTRVEDLRQQLTDARSAVNDFKTQHKIIGLPSKVGAAETAAENLPDGHTGGFQIAQRRIGDLNAQLSTARLQLREAQAKLNRVERAISEFATSKTKPTVPEQMNNPLVTRLRERLYELSNREAEWKKQFGKSHEAIEKLRSRMEEINSALLEELKRLAEVHRSEMEIARQRMDDIQDDLRVASHEMRNIETLRIKLRELESTAQAYEALHDSFVRRLQEANEQENFPIARVRILNPAAEPLVKDIKRSTRFSLALLALGIGMGVGFSFLREFRDRSFRSLTDVTEFLGKRVLSLVPLWRYGDNKLIPREARTPADQVQRFISSREPQHAAVIAAPQTAYAAAVRSISQQLMSLRSTDASLVLGITSPEPGQGASTIAAGLAAASAAAGLRILLIDGDMRNPSLTRSLAPTAGRSVLDVLKGEARIEDVLWKDRSTGFHFLPGAPDSPQADADALFASEQMSSLIASARLSFDCIILDLPPLVPMTDVMSAASLVDAFALIIRWGKTTKEPTRRALDTHPAVARKIAGVVLNQVDVKRLHLYDPLAARWFDRKLYRKYLVEPSMRVRNVTRIT